MSTFNALRRSFLTSASRSQINNALTTRSSPRFFSTSTARMTVHNLKSKAEFDDAKKDGSLMIVDAYATWCGPCKVIAPKLVE
jgi:thioredoxin 1